jgi:endonuclease/exonuclease/phosphatase family metal-dependent hydrolase
MFKGNSMNGQAKVVLNLLVVGIILVSGTKEAWSPASARSADNSPMTFPSLILHDGQLARAQGLQVPTDSVLLAQYNVQFLFPENTPEILFERENHFPSSSERARLIAEQVACRDIVAFQEISNNERRRDIFEAMEEYATQCPGGREPLIDGGTRYFDFFVGPHNSQTDPQLDDEVAIASRFPIVEVHTLVYEECSGWDCLADKGVIHARVWRGPGHPARDSMDLFATHLDAGDDESTRQAQVSQLTDFVAEHHTPGTPAVIMGDFNINGNIEDVNDPHSLYSKMIGIISGILSTPLIDTGLGIGGTNESGTSRLDYIMVAGAKVPAGVTRVDYFTGKFFDIDDPDLPQDGRLSDHGAVLSELFWNHPIHIPSPVVELPKNLRVEVSRLQEITADVPDAIMAMLISVPVLVGCDGLTDHFGSLTITATTVDGRTLENKMSFDEDYPIEGDDITREPPWAARLEVPVGITNAEIHFSLEEDDDFFCGGSNDSQDINPFSRRKGITIGVDFASNQIFAINDENARIHLAFIGEAVVLKGTDFENRARVTLVIESLYSDRWDTSDAVEAYIKHTDTLDSDTDNDGLIDGDEVDVQSTNHLNSDTDGEGLLDWKDVEWLQNAINAFEHDAFKSRGSGHRTTMLR